MVLVDSSSDLKLEYWLWWTTFRSYSRKPFGKHWICVFMYALILLYWRRHPLHICWQSYHPNCHDGHCYRRRINPVFFRQARWSQVDTHSQNHLQTTLVTSSLSQWQVHVVISKLHSNFRMLHSQPPSHAVFEHLYCSGYTCWVLLLFKKIHN